MPHESNEEILKISGQIENPPSLEQLSVCLEVAKSCFSHFPVRVISKSRQGWIDYVRNQLSSRSGTLFNYISKQDNVFLKVSLEAKGGSDRNPTVFLKNQSQLWSKLWAPSTIPDADETEHKNIPTLLVGLREHALTYPAPPPLTGTVLDQSLKGYNKDSKGSDNWISSELKALPDHSKSSMADAMHAAKTRIAQPHQHLLDLNSCLGKPNKDIRTICKTPMMYRLRCRIDQTIKDW